MAAVTIRTSLTDTLTIPISDPQLAAAAQLVIDPLNALVLVGLVSPLVDHIGGAQTLAGAVKLFVSDAAAALTVNGGGSSLFPPLVLTGTQDLTFLAGTNVAQLIASGNTTIDIPAGMAGVDAWLGAGDDIINAIGGASTIRTGGGHNQITLGIGANIVETAGFDTILAGPGVTTVQATGAVQDLVYLGSTYGTYIGSALGSATVVSGINGSSVVDHAANTLFFAAGTADFRGAGTVVGGSATVGAILESVSVPGYAGSLVFGGSGHLGVVNASGAATIVGDDAGSTDIQINAGGILAFARGDTSIHGGGTLSGAATILGIAGPLVTNQLQGLIVTAATGASTINVTGNATVFGTAAGDILNSARAALGSNIFLVGGAGAETLSGIGGMATNTFFAGSGPELIQVGDWITNVVLGTGAATLVGGAGIALYGFVAGRQPNVLVQGFDPAKDFLTLIGYGTNEIASALGAATIAGGNETLRLSDGTTMTFQGFTSLTAANFL